MDGNNDFVSVPDSDAWTFGLNDFSIALWANFDLVKSQSLGLTANTFLGHDEGPGSQNKWTFFFDDVPDGTNSGNLVFHINSGPGGVGSVFLESPTSFTVVNGQWHHFAVTRSGSTFTFYADGNSLGTRSDSREIPNASAPLTIGVTEGLGFFNGRLDEIQIFDHALSATEVAGIYAAPEPSSVVLVACGAISTLMTRPRVRRRS